jgi:hypothetical protein
LSLPALPLQFVRQNFSDIPYRPLGRLKTPLIKATRIINLLVEGTSLARNNPAIGVVTLRRQFGKSRCNGTKQPVMMAVWQKPHWIQKTSNPLTTL